MLAGRSLCLARPDLARTRPDQGGQETMAVKACQARPASRQQPPQVRRAVRRCAGPARANLGSLQVGENVGGLATD